MVFFRSYLGSRLMAIDSVTSDFIGTYTQKHSSIWQIGKSFTNYNYKHSEEDVLSTFDYHLQLSDEIKLTFSELGFSKTRVPADIMGSMLTYYHNVKDDCVVQDYGEAFVLYDYDPLLCPIPGDLQDVWLEKLIAMEEEWIGGRMKLQTSPIHGIRIYKDGFRFKAHADELRIGMIINIDQVNMKEPWMLQIYDHAHRLHEIDMQPGDLPFF